MDHTVELSGKHVKVSLPDVVPDGVPFRLRIETTEHTGVWHRTLGVLVLQADNGIERFLRVRAALVSPTEDDGSVRVEAEVFGAGAVHGAQSVVRLNVPGQAGRNQAGAGREHVVRSQITGKVLKVLVQAGDRVASGQALLLVEAMKMENRVFCQVAGIVQRVTVAEGDAVQTGKELLRIMP